MSKRILGLDIGTNSVGGALITVDDYGNQGQIDWLGSRIIPLDGDSLSKFENGGQVETRAANRRMLRSSRRLKQRYKLRRSRLIKVFKMLNWIPADFPSDFKTVQQQQPEAKFNINNYLPISEASRREAYEAFGTEKISEDWLVYFLRKKGLSERLTITELARVVYMCNQRRGFKSSRKELVQEVEVEADKWPKYERWVEILTVNSITEVGKEKDKTIFEIKAGAYVAQTALRFAPDWAGKELELEVTRKTTKSGEISYSFRKPEISDWEQQKAALHADIQDWLNRGLCKTIGEYFLIHLQEDKNYRIRQRIVDRNLYRQELEQIWAVQQQFHPQLEDRATMHQLAQSLYQHNKAKQQEIASNDLFYLISNDIIYYQRPLKSQKHLIDSCRFEKKTFIKDGIETEVGVKVAPKSAPVFQEFRIWQDIHNLKIIQKEAEVAGKNQVDVDVTAQYITPEVKASLFQLLDQSSEVSEQTLLRTIHKTLNVKAFAINLFANREKLKGNETKAVFRKVFKKHGFTEGEQLLEDAQVFERLWHILYSLEEEKDIRSALQKLKRADGATINMSEPVISHLAKLPALPKQYAAYSTKAIRKLLPLMRCGSLWSADAIHPGVATRVEQLIANENSESGDERAARLLTTFSEQNVNYLSGMPIWLATYAVYGKHAERISEEKYSSPAQMEIDKLIPANSLRNPFVEQVIRETLNVVKEVWQKYGQPDEIHIELARELKKNAAEKARISEQNSKSQQERERVRNLLLELKQGNPQSPGDLEKFRLWKANGGLEGNLKFEALFNRKNELVSKSELDRYRLWAEQGHLSPYTGKPIPLSQLFNKALYEVEHVFPKSRYFDDSLANKVICEAGVNKEKDSAIARVFIQQNGGRTIDRGGLKHTILSEDAYVAHCKRNFTGKKLQHLLAEYIPEDFVSRQLNDTRHISRKLAELLYPVAKEKAGIVFTGGSITSELKDNWGLNRVWKDLLLPRFQRLEQITGEQLVLPDVEKQNNYHFAKDYKRVDHRHHALDALVVAATTRAHIQYLNTLNASESADQQMIRQKLVKAGVRKFLQPWPTFTRDAKAALSSIIVSHKVSKRVVTKPLNRYLKWVEQDGAWKKALVSQEQPKDFGKSWTAVRRSMFKEPQGIVYLKEVVLKKLPEAVAIQIQKERSPNRRGQQPADYIYDQALRPLVKSLIKEFGGDLTAIKTYLKKNPLKDDSGNPVERVAVAVFKEYAAKRVTLDGSFDGKKIAKIPYAHHQPAAGKQLTLPQVLRNHLQEMGSPVAAFTGEGLEQLHKKLGFPLKKVTIYEYKDPASKFKGKYYETDKGGNVFFVIRQHVSGKREMYTLPLLEAIERLANKLPLVDEEEGYSWFTLSPNELVYVPEEGENIKAINWKDTKRIFDRVYKMVSCSGSECYFLPHNTANLLLPYSANSKKGEFGSLNKTENTIDGISIKRNCIKIQLDRLGNIVYPVSISLLDAPGDSMAGLPKTPTPDKPIAE